MGLLLNLAVFILAVASCTTGRDSYYNFRVGYFCGAPDGVTVCHILGVNGQFPGPTIEGTIGDTVHVTVVNEVSDLEEPAPHTTIHWHGLFQNGTPFDDGPEMVTQCGVAQNSSMTYTFELKQTGTYWYHSHTDSQYTEGLWGPLIIHGDPELYGDEYDEEIVITLNDWYHTTGKQNLDWFLSPESEGNEPIPFSNLMNGRGVYPCKYTNLPCFPGPHTPPIFQVTRNKRYRIRVINSSAFAKYFFSITNHRLEVIEVDGIDTVRGRFFDRVPIAAAQRYSFLVTMNATGGQHWVAAEADRDMYGYDGPNINPHPEEAQPVVYGKLQYTPIVAPPVYTTTAKPFSPLAGVTWTLFSPVNTYPPPPAAQGATKEDEEFAAEMTLRPADLIPAPSAYHEQVILNVEEFLDDAGVNHLTFNNIVFGHGPEPLITMAMKNLTFPPASNVYETGFGTVVQIVLNNHDPGPHPFHLHGHAFWVLGKGGTEAGDYDPDRDVLVLTGVKRDTVTVATESWAVLRFVTDNPGVWFFHCHIHWHLEGGLAMVFNEAPDELRSRFQIPEETRRVCAEVGIDV